MRVLALAGDAGGARALLPVVRWLRSAREVDVECRAYRAAASIWAETGFRPGNAGDADVGGFDRALLGTTVAPEQYEVRVTRQARELGVRTVTVLDFWSNYRQRFTSGQGEFVLPDVIAIMDEQASREMREAGFPADVLRVTGQPAFDDLAALDVEAVGARGRELLAGAFAGAPPELLILYASQPLSQLYRREELGFHEHEVLRDVVEALGDVLRAHGRRATLLVKPHPRELGAPFRLPPPPGAELAVCLLTDGWVGHREAAAASDLVIGMNSMALLEACLLRRRVLTYQPGLMLPDPLPSNRFGWSRAVYDSRDLRGALAAELFDAAARQARLRILSAVEVPCGATERVLHLLVRDT
jgi:hypothetical protein